MGSSRIFDYACTGGTYGPVHKGHEDLFDKAFFWSDNLIIRLTTDRYLDERSKKNFREGIPSYKERFEKLYRYLDPLYKGRFEILPLDDLEENCENCKFRELTKAMFVGQDSVVKAYRLNIRRRDSGLYEIFIIGVPVTLTDNGKRISSTRIRKGEITPEGRLIIP